MVAAFGEREVDVVQDVRRKDWQPLAGDWIWAVVETKVSEKAGFFVLRNLLRWHSAGKASLKFSFEYMKCQGLLKYTDEDVAEGVNQLICFKRKLLAGNTS